MKKTLKATLLLCLTVVVLLSVVSCEMLESFLPIGTTTADETTAESTPDATTPDETTPEPVTTTAEPVITTTPEPIVTTPAPDETTTEAPAETTVPDEPPVDNPDDPIIDLGGYTYRAGIGHRVVYVDKLGHKATEIDDIPCVYLAELCVADTVLLQLALDYT